MTPTIKRTEISRSVRTILVGSSAALAFSAGGTALAAESGGLDTPPALKSAGSVDALKQQVEYLMDRIERLEQQQASSDQELAEMQGQVGTVPANVVTGGSMPGSFKLPGSDTSVSVSGYVKGDLIWDSDGDVGDSFNLSATPADDAEETDNVRLHARQSRVRVRSNTELGNGGAINTHVEGDFEGTGGNELFSNSTSFRIRHAYASWDTGTGSNFLAGQTWTTFGGFYYAPTVDFFAPNGQVFLRQGQLRYTLPNGFSVAVENPESQIIDATGQFGGTAPNDQDEFPDLVAKWTGGPGGAAGSYGISGVLRQLSGAGTGLDGIAYDDDETGWGVHVGGHWNFDPVSVSAGVGYGDGLGRYVLSNTAFGAAAAVGGQVEAIESLGATLGVSIATSEASSVNFNLGYSERDDEFEALMQTLDEEGLTLHANYMWSPWPGSNLGIEVIYGEREQFNGVEGENTRVQFGAQQSF